MTPVVLVSFFIAVAVCAFCFLAVASLKFAQSLQPQPLPALAERGESSKDEADEAVAQRRLHKAKKLDHLGMKQLKRGEHEDATVSFRLANALRDAAQEHERRPLPLAVVDKRIDEIRVAAGKLRDKAYEAKLSDHNASCDGYLAQAKRLEETADRAERTGELPPWVPAVPPQPAPQPRAPATEEPAAAADRIFRAHGFADHVALQHAWWSANSDIRMFGGLGAESEIEAFASRLRGEHAMGEYYDKRATDSDRRAFGAASWCGLHRVLRERQLSCD